MRLKPTPLVEASLVFSIAWMISLIFTVIWSGDFNAALTMSSNIALLFLMLSWTLWAALGAAVRKKSHYVRFFTNLTVTSVIAVAATSILVAAFSSAKGLDPVKVATAIKNASAMGVVYFVGSLIGALLTYFLITRPKE